MQNGWHRYVLHGREYLKDALLPVLTSLLARYLDMLLLEQWLSSTEAMMPGGREVLLGDLPNGDRPAPTPPFS